MEPYEGIVRMWRGWKVAAVSDIDYRLDSFRILFASNSGRIENQAIAYNDTREIFENGRVLNYTGDPRAIFELGNQKLCYEFLKHKIAARELINADLVLETHGILTGGAYDERRFVERGERPGAFKKHDYVTGKAEVGSMPEDVPGDIEALLAEMAGMSNGGATAEKLLKAAAYFHLRFEYIHPFADGNGRVGRTLMNYFLMTRNHPPLIIYDEDKRAYYDALARYNSDEEIAPMLDFLRGQTIKTWGAALERALKRDKQGGDAE